VQPRLLFPGDFDEFDAVHFAAFGVSGRRCGEPCGRRYCKDEVAAIHDTWSPSGATAFTT
jgi:hypothetical protein